MERNDVVTIYHDPITEQKPEGEARLVLRHNKADQRGLEFWLVKMLEDGYIVDRRIKTHNT